MLTITQSLKASLKRQHPCVCVHWSLSECIHPYVFVNGCEHVCINSLVCASEDDVCEEGHGVLLVPVFHAGSCSRSLEKLTGTRKCKCVGVCHGWGQGAAPGTASGTA